MPNKTILILVISLTMIGFIYLVKIISGLQKKLNKLSFKNENKEKIVDKADYPESDTITDHHIKNTNTTQEHGSDQHDEKDMQDYHEANIMKIYKNDGIQTKIIDPNSMSLTSAEQMYKLDIIVGKPPIGKTLKIDTGGKKSKF